MRADEKKKIAEDTVEKLRTVCGILENDIKEDELVDADLGESNEIINNTLGELEDVKRNITKMIGNDIFEDDENDVEDDDAEEQVEGTDDEE